MNFVHIVWKRSGFKVILSLLFLLFVSEITAQTYSLTIHLDTAGTLIDKIDASIKDSVVSLTINGDINGSDVLFIREMAGSDKNGNPTSGSLAYLNLSKSNIREGGSFYYLYYPTLDNKVGNYIFYSCKKIISVILPESALSIGNYTFAECSNLESIFISKGLKNFGSQTFKNCQKFSGIIVDEDNEYLASKDGVLFDKQLSSLKLYPPMKTDSAYTIPSTVKTIEAEAFMSNKLLQSLFMPNSVTSIGQSSFGSCYELKLVRFSESLTNIPYNAFAYCQSLNELELPYSLVSIGEGAFMICDKLTKVIFQQNLTSIGSLAFSFCDSLRIVSLPSSLCSLGRSVFSTCFNLKKVILSPQMETTGVSTFSNCLNLEEVVIPEGINTIGASAFFNCRNLYSVLLPESLTKIDVSAFEKCSSLHEINITQNVTNIERWAFRNCTSLESVFFQKNIKEINISAFSGCLELTTFNVDIMNRYFCASEGILFSKDMSTLVCYPNKKGTTYTIPEYVSHIGDYAFSQCDISTINITDNVESIGAYAFSYCNNLTKVDLNCVLRIGSFAFCLCINLMDIKMQYAFDIGHSAFFYCKKLDSVVLPNELSKVNSGILSGCSGMQRLFIGKNVDSIDVNAFSYCTSLKELHVSNPQPALIIKSNSIAGINLDSCTLFVPKGAKVRYQLANIWNGFKTIVEETPVAITENHFNDLPLVIAANGTIKVLNKPLDCTVYIYSISGKLITKVSDDSEIKISGRGVYIVKVLNKNYKVII